MAADYNADGRWTMISLNGAAWFRQYSDGTFFSSSFGVSNVAAIPCGFEERWSARHGLGDRSLNHFSRLR